MLVFSMRLLPSCNFCTTIRLKKVAHNTAILVRLVGDEITIVRNILHLLSIGGCSYDTHRCDRHFRALTLLLRQVPVMLDLGRNPNEPLFASAKKLYRLLEQRMRHYRQMNSKNSPYEFDAHWLPCGEELRVQYAETPGAANETIKFVRWHINTNLAVHDMCVLD